MLKVKIPKQAENLCKKCSFIYFSRYSEIRDCMKDMGIKPSECRAYREYTELEKRFLKESGVPEKLITAIYTCLLYTSPSPRD